MSDYSSSIAIDIKPSGHHKDYRLISFIGNLDKAGLDEVRSQIEEIVESVHDEQYLVFNFENLEFINSESIGFLLNDSYSPGKEGEKTVGYCDMLLIM